MDIGIINLIDVERQRQDDKWGEQNHGDLKWSVILTEEVGEVAKAVLEDDHEGGIKEIIEVMAVCVAWLEAIRRRS